MITGYNHNIPHKGRTYHVQTEDSGLQHPHIITHLFVGGNIIHSLKRSYAHLLEEDLHKDEEQFEKVIREMMKAQHKDMIRSLKKGTHDHVGDRKSAGSLLTPGLLAPTSEKAEKAEKAEPALSMPTPPPLDALQQPEPLPPPPAIDLPKLDLPPPPPIDAPPAPVEAEESSEQGTPRSKRKGRLGRARPTFQAPPKKVDSPTPQSKASQATAEVKAPETPAPDTEAPATPASAARRMRRGSGRGRRPELELKRPKPSAPTKAPVPMPSDKATTPMPALPRRSVDSLTEETPPGGSVAFKESIKDWLSQASHHSRTTPPAGSTAWKVEASSAALNPTRIELVPAGASSPLKQGAKEYLGADKSR